MAERKQESVRCFGTRALGDMIKKASKPCFDRHHAAEARLLTEWASVAGKTLSECLFPRQLKFSKKQDEAVLYCDVFDARALEIQHLEPVIIERIAVFFGYKLVSRIVLTQIPLAAISEKQTITYKKPTPSKTNHDKTIIDNAIADESLRRALSRLADQLT